MSPTAASCPPSTTVVPGSTMGPWTIGQPPPVQAPFWQVSGEVLASPSSQAVPSGVAGLEHCPVAGLQAPASWHASSAAQGAAQLGVTLDTVTVKDWQVAPGAMRLTSTSRTEGRAVRSVQSPLAWQPLGYV